MSVYENYLPELKSTTLFQNIEENALIELLDVIGPEIVCSEAGSTGMPPIDLDKGIFCVVLKGKPLDQLEPRLDVYNMPAANEPGMMMGEIPCLSEMKKSRAKKVKMKGPHHGGPKNESFDLYMLRMSAEMITRFYGEKYIAAQNIMIRNFLGILAQKVTDVRKEKAVAVAALEAELSPYRLNVFCAGVSMKIVQETANKWDEMHPELPVILTSGGSVDLIRDCINGYPCDLLISADDTIVESMMMPDYAEGYRIWAGNKMVIVGDDINIDNWIEKLSSSESSFKHHDPYGDPGGYRAVMAILLADKVRPGLTKILMDHPGHIGMDRNPGPFGDLRHAKYEFAYYSHAKASGKNFTELPRVMDLSDPDLAGEYSNVSFAVDDKNVVTATPINHALTIPKAAIHKVAAQEFAAMLLDIDKEEEGFIPRGGMVGIDPIK